MEIEDITPEFVEQLTLGGLELLCKLLWRRNTLELQAKYPRYGEGHEDFEAMAYAALPEEALGFQLAFEVFAKLGGTSPEGMRGHGAGVWLEEMSLMACRLGGVASRGDVEYFFRKRLTYRQRCLADAKKEATMATPPDWAFRAVEMSRERYKTFKELGVSLMLKREAQMSGGDEDLTPRERVAIYLRRRLLSAKQAVAAERKIVAAFEKGDWMPAMLSLGEHLDVASSLYDDVEKGPIDHQTGEREEKSGKLSTFLRQEPSGNLTLDSEMVHLDFHLYQSLLKVLQPTVGRA